MSPLGTTKQRDGVGYDLSAHYAQCDERREQMTAGIEPRAELADTEDIYANTLHPYTEALLSAIPVADLDRKSNRIVL